MKFTKKQFDEIGPWYFNNLCFDSTNQTTMLKIFNLLPSHLQGLAVSWGCDDSVFRDEVFEYLIKNQFNLTTDEYYNSEIYNLFVNNGQYQKISFEKLKPKNILVDIETDGAIFVYDGNVTHIFDTMTGNTGNGLQKGELGLIMAPFYGGKTRYNEKIQDLLNKHKNNA